MEATKIIYDLTLSNRFCRDFVLCDQCRRAVVSISANISEGFEKNNNNELIRYLRIAKGSAGESHSHIYIAHMIGYIDQKQFDDINRVLTSLSKQLAGFIKYLVEKRKDNQFPKP